MAVRVGLWRRLSAKELMLLNCDVGEDSWESLGLQGDPTSPFWRRSALGFLWKEYAKAETPVLRPPHVKSWLIGKDSDAGRDWGQEEKGTTEDEMAGWHHCLNGHESEWTPGVGDGQGGLACCDSWGCKELDTTERLNWTEFDIIGKRMLTSNGGKVKVVVAEGYDFIVCMSLYIVYIQFTHTQTHTTWLFGKHLLSSSLLLRARHCNSHNSTVNPNDIQWSQC